MKSARTILVVSFLFSFSSFLVYAQSSEVRVDERGLRSDRPLLRFILSELAGTTHTTEVRLSGRGQDFQLERFKRADRIGRIRVEIPGRPVSGFLIQMLAREAADSWRR